MLYLSHKIPPFILTKPKPLKELKLIKYERQGICPNARKKSTTYQKLMQIAKKDVLSFFMSQNLIFSRTNSDFEHKKILKKCF